MLRQDLPTFFGNNLLVIKKRMSLILQFHARGEKDFSSFNFLHQFAKKMYVSTLFDLETRLTFLNVCFISKKVEKKEKNSIQEINIIFLQGFEPDFH